jgi:CheY-like chemotaxis protein
MTPISIVEGMSAGELGSLQPDATPHASEGAPPAAGGPATSGTASPSPGRLLVLDDDPVVAKVLGRSAERVGFQVVIASDPTEFFVELERWHPSHVAIDLAMPEMSGLQVIEWLAQRGCAARVIVSSGSDISLMNEALGRAAELGLATAGALSKPFSVSALRALLDARAPTKEVLRTFDPSGDC